MKNVSWVATNLAHTVNEFWFILERCGISLLRVAC